METEVEVEIMFNIFIISVCAVDIIVTDIFATQPRGALSLSCSKGDKIRKKCKKGH